MYTVCFSFLLFFFFNDPATTEIYTLSLHDALPILHVCRAWGSSRYCVRTFSPAAKARPAGEKVRTRSEEHTSELQSHVNLVCRLLLEKKKKKKYTIKKNEQQKKQNTHNENIKRNSK